jgi:polysaccharide export outer membrane protein
LLSACGTTLSETAEVDPSQVTVAKTAPTETPAPMHSVATSSIALPQQASLEAVRLTAAADPTSSAYKIGPLDLLDVTVFRVPELSKTVQVARRTLRSNDCASSFCTLRRNAHSELGARRNRGVTDA